MSEGNNVTQGAYITEGHKKELAEIAKIERRRPGNLAGLLLEWAMEQMRIKDWGSSEMLRASICPDPAAHREEGAVHTLQSEANSHDKGKGQKSPDARVEPRKR